MKPQPVTAELVNAAIYVQLRRQFADPLVFDMSVDIEHIGRPRAAARSLLLDLVSLLFLLFDQIFSAKANFFQMKSLVFLFFPKAAAPRQGETEKCRLIWLTA